MPFGVCWSNDARTIDVVLFVLVGCMTDWIFLLLSFSSSNGAATLMNLMVCRVIFGYASPMLAGFCLVGVGWFVLVRFWAFHGSVIFY